MKFLTLALFASLASTVCASGESLPWVEDFSGLANGVTSQGGPTSWTATRSGGLFEIKDGGLWLNQNANSGRFLTGDIDVSQASFVEIKTTIHGWGAMEDADFVRVFAIMEDGLRFPMGYHKNTADAGTEIRGILDVTNMSTLKVEVKAKVSANNEHYKINEVSVKRVGNPNDKCIYYDLNVDNIAAGTYLTNQLYDTHGVTFDCACNNCDGGKCRVFDTSNPIGDPDLGSPNENCPVPGPGVGNGGKPGKEGENCRDLGHLIIVDENGDNIPDDAVGGFIKFTFNQSVEMLSIDQVDNENSEHYSMEFKTSNGTIVTKLGAFTGNNGFASTPLLEKDLKDVKELKINLSGSGSVNSVKYRVCNNTQGGGGGDPHFKRWGRKSFEFHGECDLVLVHSDHVNGDKPLDIHVRTVIHEWWSQIESAAMRIGDVTLQMDVDKFFVNGQKYSDRDLPMQTDEFYISSPFDGDHRATRNLRASEANDVIKTYLVTFNDQSVVTFKILNGFMNVAVDGSRHDFGESNGLMGTYDFGKAYGRAGTKIESLHDFAMDWQVDPAQDPILFMEAKGPQLPAEKCRMPSPAETSRRRRRLAKASPKLVNQAQEACATKGEEFDACLSDILSTGDISMALLH